MNAIEAAGLSKSYGNVQALRGIDLRVPAGSLFGFLGPNGAGKTTAMRIMLGLLRSTGGQASVLGLDAWRERVAIHRRVGYLPGDARLYEWMSGLRLLQFVDRARGGGTLKESQRLAERFELDVARRVREYSRGMKQKLALIAALAHRPEVLIFDEPTTGLDPLMQHVLYDELRFAAREGRTVLFSSHLLNEVETLCDRVAIIRGGKIIEDNTIEILRARALRRVELQMSSDEFRKSATPSGWTTDFADDGRVRGSWKGPIDGLLPWLALLSPQDVTIGSPDLESLFAAYYRERPS